MRLHLSKCHIVGNHMSRLIYVAAWFYNVSEDKGFLWSGMYCVVIIINICAAKVMCRKIM